MIVATLARTRPQILSYSAAFNGAAFNSWHHVTFKFWSEAGDVTLRSRARAVWADDRDKVPGMALSCLDLILGKFHPSFLPEKIK